MNIDVKRHNKIFASQIKNTPKSSYSMVKLVSSQGYNDGSTYINQQI
jgi:hypothetical protein